MTNQFCSKCGASNLPFARFCAACGSRLSGVGQSAGLACPKCGTLALPGERFCDECGTGLPPAALFILEATGWRIALPPLAAGGERLIGREDQLSGATPDVDLAPHNAEAYGVSRRHARLGCSDGNYTLEDLESVNLTYLNDQRLEPGRRAALKDGDRITLGNLKLIFRQA
ncbi:MAG TPA: FHA domain-containing protein [Anaerolineae bacterium]|nr:FHA domain-containing protein [Anaerolineae bacterium]